mgnify:CR=1 FL=1
MSKYTGIILYTFEIRIKKYFHKIVSKYTMEYTLDIWEALTRLIKYMFEGLAVAVVAYVLPKSKLQSSEILVLGLSAACVFSILDLLAPAISTGARSGVGMGVGFNLIGFPQ